MIVGIKDKIKNSILSLSPIFVMVMLLGLTIVPDLKGPMLVSFLISSVLFVLGMSFFTLGADNSMLPMGHYMGASLTKSRKIELVILISIIIGTIITTAEPDLTVLATQVPFIPRIVLILAVSLGVGLFLAIAMVRIIFKKSLNLFLLIGYGLVIVLALFAPNSIFSVGFDSGGVTTGPITSPLILAFGVGAASVLAGKQSEEDSFGMVSMCSLGPILIVLLLGFFYKGDAVSSSSVTAISKYSEILPAILHNFVISIKEVGIAFLLIILLFVMFQIFALKLPRQQIGKVAIGLAFTFLGVVTFLASVNTGFMPTAKIMGESISANYKYLLPILCFIIGFAIVLTEPAVQVYNSQIEEVTAGTMSKKTLQISMAIGVGIGVVLAVLKIMFNFHLGYILIPGYIIALAISFFVPKIYVAAAFDAGGVATGPLTASFILPFMIGVSTTLIGAGSTDAFGIVALEAMMPIITIQLLGLFAHTKQIYINDRMKKYVVDDQIYDFVRE